MVNLQTIQAHNATLKSLAPGLVAVFVGGTSGISLSTALALARHTLSPKIYLIGRSQSAADDAIASMKTINPSAQPTFLQTDISLLKNVDSVCDEIAAKENKLNLLFMTPGYMTLKGRDETAEGLDRKFVLHYYARMRFVTKLLPLLTAAAEDPSVNANARLSRVVSVLDPQVSVRTGGSGRLDFSDLSLKHTFSLQTCQAHASLMGDFFLEGMAQRHPHTSFVHAYPSGVATGLMRELPVGRVLSSVLGTLLSPFIVPIQESGERHLFAATSGRFPPKAEGAKMEGDVAVGSDGTKGSGCYWVNWDGEVFPANKKLGRTRGEGAVEKVLQHTDDAFKQIERHAAADLEEVGAFRAQEDWRRLYRNVSRLEITSYALEFGFIHDDIIDKEIQDANLEEVEQALEKGGQTSKIEEKGGSSGKRRIVAQILREMMAIDPERATVVTKSWAAGVQHSSTRQDDKQFNTLEEYIPYRCFDVGYGLWHGLVALSCAITIPEEEADEARELLMPAGNSSLHKCICM
ncbi:hypothetical protein DTO012A7_8856 [Penicillium roqueforti]|uniref:uncharacterized protein n=1 Tax=Penicillium roqueforti TaxID=5082 RepID=UPI0019096285|nr:uncharacterized protein LCP9604111_8132 [Penicillium roqueforti]KAF9242224.1 hypothetical protein LCP9604111_8132 [Penicillium roqueforti]KAI3222190.1 hypothetical protein DTO012A7_8856 [Penicillium roqueforti]